MDGSVSGWFGRSEEGRMERGRRRRAEGRLVESLFARYVLGTSCCSRRECPGAFGPLSDRYDSDTRVNCVSRLDGV